MQRAYRALADDRGGIAQPNSETGIKVEQSIISLAAVLEEAVLGEEEGENLCLSMVSATRRLVADARDDGVSPEPLLDGYRAGLDAAFRRTSFWDVILGSVYYKGGHADLDKPAEREICGQIWGASGPSTTQQNNPEEKLMLAIAWHMLPDSAREKPL
ncbi:hypothetical protein NLG97_g10464 [Lecanicillium saksenae]|uniref:Uncharacterized protein n=1 Tax=Lecanicillium saksenae TaxID=468837 RepID=A0ACC1QDB9_9HYPO|nr:hypothetical protein NLG97_g10464 [Lecanicillium saksenae]